MAQPRRLAAQAVRPRARLRRDALDIGPRLPGQRQPTGRSDFGRVRRAFVDQPVRGRSSTCVLVGTPASRASSTAQSPASSSWCRTRARIAAAARAGAQVRRLQAVPGIGPVCAMAIATFAPDLRAFRRGRDFSAWLGLVPRQLSSGGRQKLGRTSKMGQRDIRRLLIVGAMSVVRWKGRDGGRPGSWLSRMIARKPRMLVAIALANKMARVIWAMSVRDENYRDATGAVC